jgi:hypothetical protein
MNNCIRQEVKELGWSGNVCKRERGERLVFASHRTGFRAESYVPRGATFARGFRHDRGHGIDIGSHVAIILLHTEIALEIPDLDASVTGTTRRYYIWLDGMPGQSRRFTRMGRYLEQCLCLDVHIVRNE